MTTATTVSVEVPDLGGVARASDAELIEMMRQWAGARRTIDTGLARLAAEVQVRSSLELGYDGLAQRSGARTPDALVTRITGASGPEARTLVAVGTLLEDPAPWLAPVASEVRAGRISVGAAGAIQSGLGTPTADVAADDLTDAAERLATEARDLPPEKVARRAREARDELDEAGVADREAALRAKRYLRLTLLPDGMTRLNGLLDPESAALVTDAIDQVTAPRRGGPRFVDPAQKARAEAIVGDPRTTEQVALDALVDMVRIAGAADPGRVFGTRRPSVRVHVTQGDLDRRAGAASIEGQTASVSIATAERLGCADGYLPILFEDGEPLRLGRSQRLFSRGQRDVLAAIWGGCAVPGCDRPPSWTEAHHTTPCSEGGKTDVADGILLCRHHHMLVHNNGWRIRRRGTDYTLDPPPGDALNRSVRLKPKNPTHLRALTRSRATSGSAPSGASTSGSSAGAPCPASGRT
ncbi:MAG: DUF222 domain-containing protein [Microbacteriaceae bacterium]|nr:DUF222 domain-containing protein [Microbacteriaceae bacterium]